MNIINKFLVFIIVSAFILTSVTQVHASGGIPPWPMIFSCDVYIAGELAPDGLPITGSVDSDRYISFPVSTTNGRVVGLTVGPEDSSYFNKELRFVLSGTEYSQELRYFKNLAQPDLDNTCVINFDQIPPEPTPTPTPTPTVLAPVSPTPVPVVIAPEIVDIGPLIFSGLTIISTGESLEGYSVTAVIEDTFASFPSIIGSDQMFHNLVVDIKTDETPHNGKTIDFYLNGPGIENNSPIQSRTSTKYEATSQTISLIDLVFLSDDLLVKPDPTPVPNVPLPPVVIPTVEPTIQPAPTIIGIIPTAVQASEQEIEEKTEESSSAACNKPVGNVSLFTGMGNIMTMIGPLVFFIAYRRVRKFWD